MPQMTVKQFVKALTKGKYEHDYLPAFSKKDIPQLLKYADSKILIRKYPSNLYSSYKGGDLKLGFMVLWTIENIRKNAPYEAEVSRLANHFPSNNPVLREKGKPFLMDDSDKMLEWLVERYREWWKEDADFAELRKLDPLEGRQLRWH